MLPFVLLAIGLLVIFVEFYLPGGILAVIGTAIIIGSIIVFAIQYESPLLVALYTIGVVIALAYLIKFALEKIRRSKRGFYSEQDQKGFVASSFDASTIGKVGVVDSDLKPGGHIIIERKRHSAISQEGYLVRGSKVLVVGGEGDSLIVKQFNEGKES